MAGARINNHGYFTVSIRHIQVCRCAATQCNATGLIVQAETDFLASNRFTGFIQHGKGHSRLLRQDSITNIFQRDIGFTDTTISDGSNFSWLDKDNACNWILVNTARYRAINNGIQIGTELIRQTAISGVGKTNLACGGDFLQHIQLCGAIVYAI